MMELAVVFIIAVIGSLLILLVAAKEFFYVGSPDEVLIFSGLDNELSDGTVVGYRLIREGWTFRRPVVETVNRLDLRDFPIEIDIHTVYSKGRGPLGIRAIGSVEISGDEQSIHSAIERFIGLRPEEISSIAREALESSLRAVIATLTPEEVNEGPRISEQVLQVVEAELVKLGLHLVSLEIQDVSVVTLDEIRGEV